MNIGDIFNQEPDGTYRFTPPHSGKPKKVRSPGKSLVISLIITILFAFFYFYFELPALNIHSGELYTFIILTCAVFCVCTLLLQGLHATGFKGYVELARKRTAVPFYIVCACLAIAIIGSVIGWKLFRARDYASLLEVSNGDFASEVTEISFDNIPMLDKESANVLANRKLGELSDLVSQFEVYGDSYQINYRDRPVRVTYLEYGDFFKWWNNQSKGIPAYVVVDMVTQEVTVQRLDSGIRYSPSEYFFRDINRYLRFKYPTKMFSDVNFEVDEDGNPYWVATVIEKKVGLFGGSDVAGAVLVNAVTGESEYIEAASIPSWVDRLYTAELIIQQYDYYGIYHNGFWNSLFGQTDCTTTTDGYNYIAQGDDVWVYTGITSVTGDQGNIGFILVNQRTKEARYYSCAGAEEYSAMSSAEGAVQQYSYDSTFPLLLNIEGQPTYFIALKDDSKLVKMYAMVNVQQYQLVATGTSVTSCAQNYQTLLVSSNIIDSAGSTVTTGSETVTAAVEEIRSAVINGNTVYYLKLEGVAEYFSVSASAAQEVVILDVGDRVTVTYEPADGNIIAVSSIDIG